MYKHFGYRPIGEKGGSDAADFTLTILKDSAGHILGKKCSSLQNVGYSANFEQGSCRYFGYIQRESVRFRFQRTSTLR